MQVTFTNRQITFVIFGALVGYGIMSLPHTLAQEVGTGSWISILIGTLAAVIVTLVITYLNYANKEQTIVQYSRTLVGNTVSNVFMVIYVLYFFIFLSMVLRLAGETIQFTVLPETPYWTICLALILLVGYTLLKGIKTIVKICVSLGILTLFVAITAHSLVYTQGDILNIQPLIPPFGAMDYLKASIQTVLPFMGIELLLLFPFGKSNGKKIFWVTSLTVLCIGLFYIFVVYSCFSIMGESSLVYYRDSILSTIRRIKIEQLEIFKRLDGIVIVGWIFAVYSTLILFGYGAAKITDALIKSPKPYSYNVVVLSLCLLAFIVAVIPPSFELADQILEYSYYLAILTAVLIPLTLIIATKIKQHGKKNENSNKENA
jgi:spore germination protein